MISGWGNPAEALRPLAEELRGRCNVTVVSAEELFPTTSARPDDRADDPSLLLIRRLPESCVLIGWSMGGMIAIDAAARAPERVRALALICATPRFCSGDGFRHGFPVERVRALDAGLRVDPTRTLREFFGLSSGMVVDTSEVEQRAKAAATANVETLIRGLAYLERTDLRPALPRISAPVLVVHGRRDAIVPWRAGKHLAEALPQSEWELVDDGTHDLPLVSPALVARRTERFLAERV
jgi:pimeloyl-ACP methyl ester carboxylesterase